MRAASEPLHADSLPLQIADRANPIGSEQLIAANMDPGDEDDTGAPINLDQQRAGDAHGYVGLARSQGLKHLGS